MSTVTLRHFLTERGMPGPIMLRLESALATFAEVDNPERFTEASDAELIWSLDGKLLTPRRYPREYLRKLVKASDMALRDALEGKP